MNWIHVSHINSELIHCKKTDWLFHNHTVASYLGCKQGSGYVWICVVSETNWIWQPAASWPDHLKTNPRNICKVTTTALMPPYKFISVKVLAFRALQRGFNHWSSGRLDHLEVQYKHPVYCHVRCQMTPSMKPGLPCLPTARVCRKACICRSCNMRMCSGVRRLLWSYFHMNYL